MKQSLVKLVGVILKKIQDEPDVTPSESGIRSWLIGQGYNKRDIEAAMKLVRPRFVTRPKVQDHRERAFRTLSVYEEYKLTPEARNALVRLEMYGLIDPFEREIMLDRLNHFDGSVGLEELDYLLSWVVCGNRDVESQQTLYTILEGQRDPFH